MHELSLAEQMLGPILAVAEEHNAVRVIGVTVEAGALQQVVPESLRTAFEVVSEGTLAEGATLTVVTAPVVALCRRCGLEFAVEEFVFVCPECGVADVETVRGRDLTILSLELTPCESTSSIT